MKLLTPILLILISIALFFIVVDPLRASVSQLKSDIAAYNVALDNSTALEKAEDVLLGKYNNIQQADRDRLAHFLPDTVNNIEFVLELEKIANQYNMPIKNIKFDSDTTAASANQTGSGVVIAGSPTASNTYGTFTINFDTEGDYNSFVLFLKDLEHNLRLVDIESISFSAPQGSGNANSYTYSLQVQIYWLK